jgi:hypothetical protein
MNIVDKEVIVNIVDFFYGGKALGNEISFFIP